MRTLRRVCRLFILIISSVVYAAGVQVVASVLSPEARIRFRARCQQYGSRWLCLVMGIRRSVDPAIKEARANLIVSNHIGALDPLILSATRPVTLVANAGLRSWPVVGWVARQMGVLFVARGRARNVGALIDAMRECMAAGVPVVAFPEGTTTHGETVRPFKTGVFVSVADREGAHVLPVYLWLTDAAGGDASESSPVAAWAGGERSFAAYGWTLLGLRHATMQVRAGRPLPTNCMGRKALAERAHATVRALFETHAGASPTNP
ncbi:MAG: 1-acyl-sn-glycerol-3-phosphate acyltransferase [Bacteroidetes bacterium]|jgi:1-acyl-sn-glycerol-3-phosphate acyltransferase|nr:1-acyl-sn-glycerol-3-phosphate acyltransferase [Bacteroidota bacterium]